MRLLAKKVVGVFVCVFVRRFSGFSYTVMGRQVGQSGCEQLIGGVPQNGRGVRVRDWRGVCPVDAAQTHGR
jgi:hypothetical protein